MVFTDQGLVDDTDLINKAFIEKRLATKGKKESESQITPTVDGQALRAPVASKSANPALQKKFDMEALKVERQTQKLQHEIEMQQAQLNKMAGKLIPTDLVIGLFQQNFKSFIDAFKNGADALLVDIAKKARLSRNDVAELRGQLIKVINSSVDEGVDNSMRTVKNIVDEYSQGR